MLTNPISFTEVDNNEIEIVSKPLNFSYLKSNPEPLPTGPDLPISVETESKPKRGRRKAEPESTEIIKATGEVVETKTIDTYQDNLNVLKNTIAQIDAVTCDIKKDFDDIRSSRTAKGKYQYISLLSKNITDLLATKVQAIKEINTTIKNSNDLDYRREKDRKEADAANDDQAIMNLYNAFVSAPVSQTGMTGRDILGPSTGQMTISGSTGIIRSNQAAIDNDPGYTNYVNNITPEQNLLRYEKDPNVKTVVVYDKATGNKYFDVMNVATGQSIPNVPRRDPMFMEDTTIDVRNKIARNINLNETYPLIILNENASINEY